MDSFGRRTNRGRLRIEGESLRIEGEARVQGAKRPRIEGEARVENKAREKTGARSGEGAYFPQKMFE